VVAQRLSIIQGNITEQSLDAIVNAANNSLLGGRGVDGAIHRVAGPRLLEECRTLGGCETGAAKITKGYNLPAKWVVHTVGPVWHGGSHGEDKLLAGCYKSCFTLAKQYKITTIAFPSISTGVYGYPVEQASRIALKAIQNALRENPSLQRVVVVCFDSHTFQTYQTAAEEIITEE
jgi:O-acetyl-ADP-ribose deacetylase (regulator of RNase III)